ncbi:STAS domain-containing protein [Streptomyces sp. NPDC002564]|uniref:STAS domain-containing protein n=1 Tax=Streptomyces sp. NPDC002564 TaxID=3364649 RepID=UPI0036AF6752
MSRSSTAPILPVTTARAPVRDASAEISPDVMVIRSCTTLGTTLVVHLAGEIDHDTVSPLRALVASAAADGYTGLVLETQHVTFCDSDFLAVLDWWPRRGRRLRLATRSRAVRHLLDVAASLRPSGPWQQG